MTVTEAIAKGLATPVRVHYGWFANCPTCEWRGRYHEYKGPASADARDHNKEKHPC